MESPSPSSSLRQRLRATVCCCFGQQQGAAVGERMRWSRRAGAGEFRYDPLSYALNFDNNQRADDDDDVEEEEEEDVRVYYAAGRGDGGLMYQSFSSRLPTPSPAFEVA